MDVIRLIIFPAAISLDVFRVTLIITICINRVLGSLVLSALKIWFMRSTLWVLILRKQTTFYGHLSWVLLWVVWRKRGITILNMEMLVTERTLWMLSSEGWTRSLFDYTSSELNLRFVYFEYLNHGMRLVAHLIWVTIMFLNFVCSTSFFSVSIECQRDDLTCYNNCLLFWAIVRMLTSIHWYIIFVY